MPVPLQPTVCERELCVFAFQTLGVMNEAADEIATGAQVPVLIGPGFDLKNLFQSNAVFSSLFSRAEF